MPSLLRKILTVFLISILLQNMGFGQTKNTLILQVEGIREPIGYMMVAVFDKAGDFLSENMFNASKHKVSSTRSMEIALELPFGEYGISVYHDLNADGKLDTNLLGIPREPTGFSNDVPIRFGPPGYDKVKFSFTEDRQAIMINLKY